MNNMHGARPRFWTPEILSEATKGVSLGGGWLSTGVAIDSREVKPGDLFIALKGEKSDGHDFIYEALKRGASAFLIQEDPDSLLERKGWDFPLGGVQVEDTKKAMWQAAKWIRKRLPAKIIGVTGSVGKTSTKALLGHLLSAQAITFFDEKSLNTKIGIALTLMRASPECQFGVVELGMNQPGEIAPMAKDLGLDYGMITMIAPAHKAAFAHVAQIAQEKFSITEGLSPQGSLILNSDMPFFDLLKGQSQHPIFSYGKDAHADLRLIDWAVVSRDSSIVRACFKGENPFEFTMRGMGYPRAMCVLGGLLALKIMGGDLALALESIESFQGVACRGIVRRCPTKENPKDQDYVTIIDESYNASPVSVEQGLISLAAYQNKVGGRSIAVLGDMLELGDQAIAFHAGIASHILDSRIQGVYLCGPLMAPLRDKLPSALVLGYAENSSELAEIMLRVGVLPGDILMVKGSLGMKMIRIIDDIMNHFEQHIGEQKEG